MSYMFAKLRDPYFTIKNRSWDHIKDQFNAFAKNGGAQVLNVTKSSFKDYVKICLDSDALNDDQTRITKMHFFETNVKALLGR